MLSLSPAKLVVVLVIALIVLGPEKLPQVARQLGGFWGDIRKWRAKLESEVRSTFPDLPPTHEVVRAVRSPLSFLDRLADQHEGSSTNGDRGLDDDEGPARDDLSGRTAETAEGGSPAGNGSAAATGAPSAGAAGALGAGEATAVSVDTDGVGVLGRAGSGPAHGNGRLEADAGGDSRAPLGTEGGQDRGTDDEAEPARGDSARLPDWAYDDPTMN
jgi:sec-independent protein translocase protein TatB